MYYSQGRDRWFGRIQCAPTMNGVASVLSHCSSLSCLLYKPALFAKQARLVQQTRQACPGWQSLSSSEVFGIMLQVLSDLVPSSTKSCTKFWYHALHLSSKMACFFYILVFFAENEDFQNNTESCERRPVFTHTYV